MRLDPNEVLRYVAKHANNGVLPPRKPARKKPGEGAKSAAKRKRLAIMREASRPPIVLTFRLPTSVNALYKRTRRGVYLNPDAVAWKESVAITCTAQRIVPFVGPVKVTTVYFNSRMDEDNGNKLCRDALEGFCYLNDRQVKASAGEKREDGGAPRMEVTIVAADAAEGGE